MANGTIREEFLKQTLGGGFNGFSAVLVAKDSGNSPLASESLTFNNASDGSITTPTIVLNLSQDDVVTKLELQTTGGTVLWDITQTFDFTQAGTLTVSLTFNLNEGTIPVISGGNVSFPVGARTYILGNGLAGRTIRGVFDGTNVNEVTDTGTMGAVGSITSSSTEASISLVANSISVNIPGGGTVENITVWEHSTNTALFSLFNDNPNLYSFTEAGTLTFSNITFVVSI